MMNKTATVIAATLIATSAFADDFDTDNGKELVDEHCYACHGNEIYTRQDHRVQNRGQLSAQVQRCEQMLKLQWFDSDIEDSAEYLNIKFYHYKK
ncbi:MAG: cytochrome c [Gammaproteobacteria bacterium]|nr:cytochrome c [Gammaproteobacteria bacterium]